MIWMDYSIESAGKNWTVKGDWHGEVWQDKEGNPKSHALYKPGDVFVVDENGWLRKIDEVNALLLKYESTL